MRQEVYKPCKFSAESEDKNVPPVIESPVSHIFDFLHGQSEMACNICSDFCNSSLLLCAYVVGFTYTALV